jgi:two-component sensor histidine kinase
LYANEGNEAVKKVVEEVNQRIGSLAQAYDQISDKEDGKNNLRIYITDLVNNLLIGVKPKIEVELEIDDVELYIKRTVYIGVVINELITNSLKHAFKNQSDRKIQISIKSEKKYYRLTYLDNGPGLPEGIFEKHGNSTGVQLIQMFSSQLGGRVMQIQKDEMSGYEIDFPIV